MKRYLLLCLVALFAVMQTGPLLAENAQTVAFVLPQATPFLQACPEQSGPRIDLAQISQSDCCKGHKGVCGCRAGKIVCCDNTTSPVCTCHSDWDSTN